jgi:hypothetical protein
MMAKNVNSAGRGKTAMSLSTTHFQAKRLAAGESATAAIRSAANRHRTSRVGTAEAKPFRPIR